MRAWGAGASGADLLQERDLPAPKPGKGQVVLRVEATVLGWPELCAAARLPDLVPGGSAVGTVVEAGDDALHLIGSRAAVGPSAPCGECYICARGRADACPSRAVHGVTVNGALATHLCTTARWICELTRELELPGAAAALLGREASVAYTMLVRANLAPGYPSVVVGATPVAHLLTQLLRARGMPTICLTPGAAPTWHERARALGAISIESPPSTGRREAVIDAARASNCDQLPAHVFETTGTPAGQLLAAHVCPPGGDLLCLAPPVGDSAGNGLPPSLLGDGITVASVLGPHPDLMPEVAALAKRADLDLGAACQVFSDTEIAAATAKVGDLANAGRAPVVTLPATT